jgi:hypothetical protein
VNQDRATLRTPNPASRSCVAPFAELASAMMTPTPARLPIAATNTRRLVTVRPGSSRVACAAVWAASNEPMAAHVQAEKMIAATSQPARGAYSHRDIAPTSAAVTKPATSITAIRLLDAVNIRQRRPASGPCGVSRATRWEVIREFYQTAQRRKRPRLRGKSLTSQPCAPLGRARPGVNVHTGCERHSAKRVGALA